MFLFESSRFKFRNFQSSDATWMYELNGNPSVLKYTGDKPFESLSEAQQFLEGYTHYEKFGYGRWAVIEKSNGAAIGWCGLKNNGDGEIDLGFRFFEKHWKKGFATESAQACLNFGFKTLGLNRIIGRCSKEHLASAKVLKKIGMEKIGESIDDAIGPIFVFQIQGNVRG